MFSGLWMLLKLGQAVFDPLVSCFILYTHTLLLYPYLIFAFGPPPGYLIMTDEWFSEYVYEVVVDKKFLSDEVKEVNKQEPVILPAWDPMGALA